MQSLLVTSLRPAQNSQTALASGTNKLRTRNYCPGTQPRLTRISLVRARIGLQLYCICIHLTKALSPENIFIHFKIISTLVTELNEEMQSSIAVGEVSIQTQSSGAISERSVQAQSSIVVTELSMQIQSSIGFTDPSLQTQSSKVVTETTFSMQSMLDEMDRVKNMILQVNSSTSSPDKSNTTDLQDNKDCYNTEIINSSKMVPDKIELYFADNKADPTCVTQKNVGSDISLFECENCDENNHSQVEQGDKKNDESSTNLKERKTILLDKSSQSKVETEERSIQTLSKVNNNRQKLVSIITFYLK